MRFDPAGWPFVIGGAVISVLVWLLAGPIFGLPLLLVSGFLLFFFRDPERIHDAPASAVLSPADGRVMVAGEPELEERAERLARGIPIDSATWRQVEAAAAAVGVDAGALADRTGGSAS